MVSSSGGYLPAPSARACHTAGTSRDRSMVAPVRKVTAHGAGRVGSDRTSKTPQTNGTTRGRPDTHTAGNSGAAKTFGPSLDLSSRVERAPDGDDRCLIRESDSDPGGTDEKNRPPRNTGTGGGQ